MLLVSHDANVRRTLGKDTWTDPSSMSEPVLQIGDMRGLLSASVRSVGSARKRGRLVWTQGEGGSKIGIPKIEAWQVDTCPAN